MKKSVIIGCYGEAFFCEKDKIDYLYFVMGEFFRECKISINGSVVSLKTELIGNQMIEAQEIFEELGFLALSKKDLDILKKRLPLIQEVGELYKIASYMKKERITECKGQTFESIEQRIENIGAELEKLELSIEYDFSKSE